MATIKAYTDLEQSKKLAKILPLESADMRYGYIAPYDYSDRMYDGGYDEVPYPKDFLKKNPNFSENEYDGGLACWSLAALLNALPITCDDGRHCLALINSNPAGTIEWLCCYEDCNGNMMHESYASNQVDACYELILKLHEQKLL